jgi:2-methylcitrate dehydratase PrpD
VAASNGVDRVIRTKEQADHSLPCLRAVALLDGDVMPAQFNAERIIKPDVQTLLKKVSVRPNHEYTELYPEKMPAKIIVRLGDGRVIEQEVQDYASLPIRSPGKTRSRSSTRPWAVASTRSCLSRSRMPCIRWKTSRSGT